MSLLAKARAVFGIVPDPLQSGVADAIWNEREGITLMESKASVAAEDDRVLGLMSSSFLILPSGRRVAVKPTRLLDVTEFTAYSSSGIPAKMDQRFDGIVMKAWSTAFAQAVARELAPGHPIGFATEPSREGVKCMARMLSAAIDAGAPLRVNEAYSVSEAQNFMSVTLPGDVEVVNATMRMSHRNEENQSFSLPTTLVRHPRFGTLRYSDVMDRVGDALRRAPLRAVSETFPSVGCVGLPSAPTGNARAGGILRLCAQAIAIDPDMTDPAGGRIAPLVHEHLPRLLKRHAEATVGAASSDLARIDAELDEGLELVRAGVERALASVRSARRDALATELGFLRARHPSERTFP